MGWWERFICFISCTKNTNVDERVRIAFFLYFFLSLKVLFLCFYLSISLLLLQLGTVDNYPQAAVSSRSTLCKIFFFFPDM